MNDTSAHPLVSTRACVATPQLRARRPTLAALLPALLTAWIALALGCDTTRAQPRPPSQTATTATTASAAPHKEPAVSAKHDTKTYTKPSPQELKRRLTQEQYEVTQRNGTEPAFRNAYWDNHAPGIYVDLVSGEPLFSSQDKFDSGTGWPSFTRALVPENIALHSDVSHGMRRTEVRSKHGDAHLGHVFDDGPAPTGQRYCMNSAALRFIPANKLVEQGYAEYAQLFPQLEHAPARPQSKQGPDQTHAKTTPESHANTRETALLAGGCFWGMENILRDIPGVIDTEVGYSGGDLTSPSYEAVSSGRTGHAETVRVVFNPNVLSYEELLGYFFRMHDPTTLNRQENDVGTQYRSAIFVLNDEQRRVAEAVRARVGKSGKWQDPIVTQIVPAGKFWKAEDYHQDYLVHNPNGYNCHVLRD